MVKNTVSLDVKKFVVCPDCKVRLLSFDGPIHEYLGGNASCWKMYGEILAREYNDSRYMKFHRWTVDAYAAQHPGKPEPRATASVNIHLLALFLLIEQEREPAFITKVMQGAINPPVRIAIIRLPVERQPYPCLSKHRSKFECKIPMRKFIKSRNLKAATKEEGET